MEKSTGPMRDKAEKLLCIVCSVQGDVIKANDLLRERASEGPSGERRRSKEAAIIAVDVAEKLSRASKAVLAAVATEERDAARKAVDEKAAKEAAEKANAMAAAKAVADAAHAAAAAAAARAAAEVAKAATAAKAADAKAKAAEAARDAALKLVQGSESNPLCVDEESEDEDAGENADPPALVQTVHQGQRGTGAVVKGEISAEAMSLDSNVDENAKTAAVEEGGDTTDDKVWTCPDEEDEDPHVLNGAKGKGNVSRPRRGCRDNMQFKYNPSAGDPTSKRLRTSLGTSSTRASSTDASSSEVASGNEEKICLRAGCEKTAVDLFCEQHQQNDALEVLPGMCKQPGCKVQPSYGEPGKRVLYCKVHHHKQMVALVSLTECEEKGCTMPKRWGDAASKKAHFCRAHATPTMVNVTLKTCHFKGCDVSRSYGKLGTQNREFCGTHKKDGMVLISRQ